MWETLNQLQRDGTLVDLKLYSTSLYCFVSRVSADFAVLSVVTNKCEFDGIAIVRTEDVCGARWGTRRLKAWEKVLAESPSAPEPSGFIDLASWESVVLSLKDRVDMLSFQEQNSDRDWFIGTNITIQGNSLQADELDNDGGTFGRFSLPVDGLLRIDYNGRYENTLTRLAEKRKG